MKILLVDDSAATALVMKNRLTNFGHDVVLATNGSLGVDLFRKAAPDLVIMDIQLPHISGVELIRMMRVDPALEKTPVMAVTAYAGKGDESRVREAGADAYVSKPISVARFVEAVEALAGSLGEGGRRSS